MKKIRTIEELPIDSTELCCNFVNTVYSWKGEDHFDFLTDYKIFIDWCVKLSVLEKSFLIKLRKHAISKPVLARRAMRKIIKLRQIMHDFISAIANNKKNKLIFLLAEMNPFIGDAFANIEIEFSEGILVSNYKKTQPVDLMRPVWVIVKSLYDMLTRREQVRIKECSSCGWVFYDETRNGKRRWCNPLNCGTKDKMDRYTNKLSLLNNRQTDT